ncbi:hypothetical protein CPLU01_13068 [Colletotrichum plurivorum]|uniref:O-methyltransferase C-terminal domain-containing protein n=1 Tax=Colletotrichum plurivorum TaxID=2175906 RepID=A0A8H6JU70_9PEZI|nr:hypothetical protein CPLU01_13068 [Colletotrichum plurivorum]
MTEPLDLSVATRASDPDAVSGLIQDINDLHAGFKDGEEEIRHELILKTRSLLHSLQTPRELMVQHTWADPGLNAAIITGVDIGLWKLMVNNGAEKPQRVADLAGPLGVDPVLLGILPVSPLAFHVQEAHGEWIGRLLRHVCAMGHLEETARDEYKLTSFSKSLSLDVIGDGYFALLGGIGRSPIEFYKFLRATNWRNPTDAAQTAMHAAYGTDLPNCFEYLRSIGLGPQTNHHIEKTLFPDMDGSPEAPLCVDVAGGLGHDIDEFKKLYPNHPGKLILQDLPVVIKDVKGIDPSIQLMGHDFLAEQPVKGAKAYFMHSIMHDWPDDVCKTILGRLAEAMQPGYSKLLIFEVVIPPTGAYWEATAGDILMMTQLSAVERTEEHWYQLIEGSGLKLKIVKFWKCGQSDVENLIECELA